MVGLAGATAFCEAIEAGFERREGARQSAAAMAVLDRAAQALKEFVDGLGRGQANVPLRLLPMYRELCALRGDAVAAEQDLFFPDLALEAPAPAEPGTLLPEEFRSVVQAQRARFQRGMLAMLRQQGGTEEMRAALDTLHQFSAHSPTASALWWAGGALVDALGAPPDHEWLQRARRVLHRLDLLIRDTAAGTAAAGESLLRDVLYAVGKCRPVTPRVREVKQLYLLDSLFPQAQAGAGVELDMDWLQPALADVRSRLEALKSMWLQYISGEAKSAARFRELVAEFRAKAAELGNPHLAKLLDAVALVAARLPDPYEAQNQYMVVEMASAFLLAEGVVESFADPAADLEQQIGIMGGWLLDAADGKSTGGERPAGLRADLSERIGALQLRAQVAREIAANLKHVE
jgi:chemosensory pili system protein ChpA (sensor histidine kinase/response regulator)